MKRCSLVVGATVLGVALCAVAAGAADAPPEINLVIDGQRFQPEELRVKAGAPFVIAVTNKGTAVAEFESKELRIEKVVPAGKTVKVKVRALKPGTYSFGDDYHKDIKGRIVAE